MRHNSHYVEDIISRTGAAIGRMIPIEQIQPNADQPRKQLGDLQGLTDSVREKGVLEPLLVRYLAESTPRAPRVCESCRALRKTWTTAKRWRSPSSKICNART
jgi:hypothetical protein